MKRKGLTLIEILLSVAIVSISAVIIVKVFLSAGTMNDRTRDHDDAVFAAVSIIEQIRYEDIAFLFSDKPDSSRLQFLDGFEVFSEKNGWMLKKELETGMFATVRIHPEQTSVKIGIGIYREQSQIYELSKVFHRRMR